MQAKIFVSEGVDKIRLTGGEPTLRKDLQSIATELGALPGLRTLAMTSNGVALRRKLQPLSAAGLSALNISLDTLQEDRFQELTRRKGSQAVLDCISDAVQLGYAVKINVVVMRGINEDEVCDFVELTRRQKLNVRFIEYMPFDDNAWSKQKMVSFPMAPYITRQSPRYRVRTSWPHGGLLRFRATSHGCHSMNPPEPLTGMGAPAALKCTCSRVSTRASTESSCSMAFLFRGDLCQMTCSLPNTLLTDQAPHPYPHSP